MELQERFQDIESEINRVKKEKSELLVQEIGETDKLKQRLSELRKLVFNLGMVEAKNNPDKVQEIINNQAERAGFERIGIFERDGVAVKTSDGSSFSLPTSCFEKKPRGDPWDGKRFIDFLTETREQYVQLMQEEKELKEERIESMRDCIAERSDVNDDPEKVAFLLYQKSKFSKDSLAPNRREIAQAIEKSRSFVAGFTWHEGESPDTESVVWSNKDGYGYRKEVPAQIREEVLERDGRECVDCGSKERLEIHHIQRVSEGGLHEPCNLETLCKECHKTR